MRALTGSDYLEIWERGRRLHTLDQGLLALSCALPEVAPESLADWPLGQRNQVLLELYCCCVGPQIVAWTGCAECGEKMELALDAREFLAGRGENATAGASIVVAGRSFRLPTSRDLAWLMRANDKGSTALRLIERCHVADQGLLALSPEEVSEIEEQMAAADPLAEIRIALCCPTCSLAWDEPLDVSSFLWAEIEARGKKLLREVHTLASAYGWTESEVLAVGESRRSLYLEMVLATSAGTPRHMDREAELKAVFG